MNRLELSIILFLSVAFWIIVTIIIVNEADADASDIPTQCEHLWSNVYYCEKDTHQCYVALDPTGVYTLDCKHE